MMPGMNEERTLAELAGEFLTGTLPDEDHCRFEGRLLDDPAAKQAVDQWEERMASFLGSNANAALRTVRNSRGNPTSLEGSASPPQEKPTAWSTMMPGVAGLVLHYDHLVGSMVYVVRMEPGTRCPTALQGSPEDCLLVSGDFSLGNVTLKAGDDHHAPSSIIHSGGGTEAGAVMLIRARDA